MKTRKGQRRRQTAKPKAHIDQKQNKANAQSKQPKERRRQKPKNKERSTLKANSKSASPTNQKQNAKNKKGAPKKLRCAFQAKPKTKNLKPEKNWQRQQKSLNAP
jgi:hypothetical protein